MVEGQLNTDLHLLLQDWLPSHHPKTPFRKTVGTAGGLGKAAESMQGVVEK